MTENEISYKIRGAIFKVYNHFGPGLFESVYVAALYIQLLEDGLNIRKEVGIPCFYNEQDLGLGFRMDLLVEEKVIVEVKSIKALEDVHHKQLLTYLKLTNLKLGILVNLNSASLEKNIVRIVNNL